jgi:hypothetical protein
VPLGDRAQSDGSHLSGSPDPAQYAAAHALLAGHLEGEVSREPWVQVVEYDASIPRWYVRFGCDGRDAATSYFVPDPPGHHEDLYRFLLQRNHALYGARFSIGPDGDVYLTGRTLLEHLDVAELDRIIGVLYELVEQWFQPVLRIAFRRP